jgi:hypothetical protein
MGMGTCISRVALAVAALTIGCVPVAPVADPSAGRGADSVCNAGYRPAPNDPSVCCPQAAPYAANDGYCYESARQVVAYARCREYNLNSAETDGLAQVMLGFIEDSGFTRSDLIQTNIGACRSNCGNNDSCIDRCLICYMAILSVLFDG